jgi:hypothetical protein
MAAVVVQEATSGTLSDGGGWMSFGCGSLGLIAVAVSGSFGSEAAWLGVAAGIDPFPIIHRCEQRVRHVHCTRPSRQAMATAAARSFTPSFR